MAKQSVDKVTKKMSLYEVWPEKQQALDLMNKIKNNIDELERVRAIYKTDMAELVQQGIDYAGTTWKDGKYLYLIYPAKNGEDRRRVYVGADEARCKEAIDRLERGGLYDQKKRELEVVESKLRSVVWNLQMIAR